MAYLKRLNRSVLLSIAAEFDTNVAIVNKVSAIVNAILNASDYEEGKAKLILERILKEREAKELVKEKELIKLNPEIQYLMAESNEKTLIVSRIESEEVKDKNSDRTFERHMIIKCNACNQYGHINFFCQRTNELGNHAIKKLDVREGLAEDLKPNFSRANINAIPKVEKSILESRQSGGERKKSLSPRFQSERGGVVKDFNMEEGANNETPQPSIVRKIIELNPPGIDTEDPFRLNVFDSVYVETQNNSLSLKECEKKNEKHVGNDSEIRKNGLGEIMESEKREEANFISYPLAEPNKYMVWDKMKNKKLRKKGILDKSNVLNQKIDKFREENLVLDESPGNVIPKSSRSGELNVPPYLGTLMRLLSGERKNFATLFFKVVKICQVAFNSRKKHIDVIQRMLQDTGIKEKVI